jgi:tetratricopeptide (TPR) repeat protein
MFELKRIGPEAIPAALDKAERYRLLNQPEAAESICEDVLAIDPENQAALVWLLLALTDQFRLGDNESFHHAEAVLPRLHSEYERQYYSGLIWERRASARLNEAVPGSGHVAYAWLCKAMSFYEKAEAIRPHGNDDALLRWNTCARLVMHHHLEPEPAEQFEPAFGE